MALVKCLRDRLRDGEFILAGEGYLVELERRGYLQAGAFVPEVVIDHPQRVKSLHEEFVFNGSDIVEALTFYVNPEKLALVGREEDLEQLNRDALRLARAVADDTGSLMAGNISNTTFYTPGDKGSEEVCRGVFKEQVIWAVQEKADFIIAESFKSFGEAKLALDCIREFAPGLAAVVTMAPNSTGQTYDGMHVADAVAKLEALGADVVGLNCYRGPDTILPLIREIRDKCKGPIACLPVPYRTDPQQMTMLDLKDQRTGQTSFPLDSDSWLCSRSHIADFTRQLVEMGVQYMGLCCGNRPYYMRTMAETLGRSPPASRYSADLSKHYTQVDKPQYKFTKQSFHNMRDAQKKT